MKRILIIVFLISWVNVSFSQMKAYVLRNPLKIGEQTELIYEIKGKGTLPSISFPAKSGMIKCEDKMNSLEIIGTFYDTFIKQQDTWTWRGTYVVTAWDSGKFVVPTFQISLDKKVVSFNKVEIDFSFPKVSKDGKIKDINEIYTDIPSEFQTWIKKNYAWIIWTLIVIAIVILGWYIYKKRKNRLPKQSLKYQTHAEKAKEEIEKLVQQKYWIEHGEKEYYFQLSLILKSYLGTNYQLSLSEKTSYEIQLLLNQIRVDKNVLDTIQWVLQQSDMVKFAKSEPSELDMINIGMRSKTIIDNTFQAKP